MVAPESSLEPKQWKWKGGDISVRVRLDSPLIEHHSSKADATRGGGVEGEGVKL